MNSESSQLKEQDLVQWLDNKLGDPTELWASRQASSLLNEQMIVELETCFQALEPHVKNKILQAMLHLSTKLIQAWRDPLNNLLNLARRDADDWVELVADMFRDFPDQGCIQCMPSNPDSTYYKTLGEMCQRLVEFVDQNPTIAVLPPDCASISHSAIITQYGFEPLPPKKHFTVVRKTKSQQLMEEVDRAAEQLNNPANKKSGGIVSSLPIKMRSTAKNPNNQLPMRGIPSASTSKFSGGFTNEPKKFQRQLAKRDGGAKLIDIAELPPQQGGRRRRVPEPKPKPKQRSEDTTATALEQWPEPASNAQRDTDASLQDSMTHEDERPPMAAGTSSAAVGGEPGGSVSTIAPDPKAVSDLLDKDPESMSVQDIRMIMKLGEQSNAFPVPIASALHLLGVVCDLIEFMTNTPLATSSEPPGPQVEGPVKKPAVGTIKQPTNNPNPQTADKNPPPVQQPSTIQAPPPAQAPLLFQQPTAAFDVNALMAAAVASAAPLQNQNQQNAGWNDQTAVLLASITKDANLLTQTSYAVITSFLGGSRANPFHDTIGAVVTLPLSEHLEIVRRPLSLDVHLVELFFQMDYQSGEWKRLRKSRLLTADELATERIRRITRHIEVPPTAAAAVNPIPPQPQLPMPVRFPLAPTNNFLVQQQQQHVVQQQFQVQQNFNFTSNNGPANFLFPGLQQQQQQQPPHPSLNNMFFPPRR